VGKEDILVNHFYQFARGMMTEAPRRDDFVYWLSRMQHYGLPTRLLDWTLAPLIALYFAVNKDLDKDGCIWTLNPSLFNLEQMGSPVTYHMDANTVRPFLQPAFRRYSDVLDEYKEKIENKVIACVSVEYDLRIIHQQSAFTIHQSDTPLERLGVDDCMQKIIIPAKFKGELFMRLECCGYTLSYMFPDFEYIAKDVMNRVNEG